jgi:hypothetical protein
VLLSVVGPYREDARQPNRTAFNIFKDAVYITLRHLPTLARDKPEKIADYFPEHVTYDAATNRLTHTYRDGVQRVTNLSSLTIPAFSLTNPRLQRQLTDYERKSIERAN